MAKSCLFRFPAPRLREPGESPYNIDREELQERFVFTMPKEKIHPNYAAVRVIVRLRKQF